MRKLGGVLLTVAIALPMALITGAPPGSAATTGLTCTKLVGAVTWSPAVPATPKTAKSNVTLKGTLSGCTGTTKIVSGAIALPVIKTTPASNCTLLLTKPPKITEAGGSITWASTKTKSTLGLLTLTPAGAAVYKATAKVASGQFVGKTLTLTGAFAPNGCPLTKAVLSLKKGTTATIK